MQYSLMLGQFVGSWAYYLLLLGLLMMMFIVGFGFVILRIVRSASKPSGTQLNINCTSCGYNLRGIIIKAGMTCPECGTIISMMR